jgi:MFS family permease
LHNDRYSNICPHLHNPKRLKYKEDEQGAAIGVFRSAGSLARAIGPLMAAFLYFAYGSKSAYLFGAVIVVIPFILALKLPKPNKESH